jgi:hypothetical protein
MRGPKERLHRSPCQQSWKRAVRLTPSITDLGGLTQPGAPVLGYTRGAVDEHEVHKRMWKDIADFLAASADEWGVA